MRALRLFDRRSLSATLLLFAAPLGCESPAQRVDVRRAALEDGGPFIAIDSCAELQAMEQDLDALYVLTADIDCTGFDAGDGKGFRPVGSGGTTFNPFTGMLDGDGHIISGLTINRPWTNQVGLFGLTYQAQIENVGLQNTAINGYQYVAGLIGAALDTDVAQCFVTGTIQANGLTGGLVGELKASSALSDSYTTATVTRSGTGPIGLAYGAVLLSATATRTYAAGTNNAPAASVAGMIDMGGAVNASFFDCTIAGNCTGAGGAITAVMQSEAQYVSAGWNLDTVWGFAAAGTYPCLRWQDGCADDPCAETDESCNGMDEDCSGTADEDFEGTSTTCGTGACASTGSTSCVNGSISDSCQPSSPSSSDPTCNAIDDDCDDTADENYAPASTTCQQASCIASGTTACQSGVVVDQCPSTGVCTQETACDDATDNDSDNAPDCQDLDCVELPSCYEQSCTNDADDNGNGLTDCADPSCEGVIGCIAEICGNSLDDDGDSLADCADVDCNSDAVCMNVPPPIEEVATPIDPTIATTTMDAFQFLFTGEDPIQRGVMPGTLEEERIALLSGFVGTFGGAPLPGVLVTVLNHPELGHTYTDLDGKFHIAVNGGETFTIGFERDGFMPAQRQVATEFRLGGTAKDTLLLPRTDVSANVAVGGSATDIQVAAGPMEVDDDGARRGVLAFPPGIAAHVFDENGAVLNVSNLTLRVTEYTVGEEGVAAMPASLPPTSAFTYAVDLTPDEAGSKVNGADVVLSEPVPFYVDNFLDFPIGTGIPTGYYDDDAGVWKAIDNGVVIEILSESAGIAAIDSNGDGVAEDSASLALLHASASELETLAELYQPGQSIWRVRLPHLSVWDLNMGAGPTQSIPPPEIPWSQDPPVDDPFAPACQQPDNSTVDCLHQRLAEDVPIPGTPYTLHYDADQVPGRKVDRTWTIPLQAPEFQTTPSEVLWISVTITRPDGTEDTRTFSKLETEFVYTWDGLTGDGRPMVGRHSLKAKVTYHYACAYGAAARFADFGGAELNGGRTRENCVSELSRYAQRRMEAWDFRPKGLGGWTIDVHHHLDHEDGSFKRGDGQRSRSRNSPATEVVGTFPMGSYASTSFAVAPNGVVYFAAGDGLRRVLPDGTNTLVLPRIQCSRNGSEALTNTICGPSGVTVGPDGTIYIGDRTQLNGTSDILIERILRVDPVTFAVTRIAGGVVGFSGEGGPALDAQIRHICDMQATADGNLYLLNCANGVLQRIAPDGRLERVAGTAGPYSFIAEHDDARQVPLGFQTSGLTGGRGSGGFEITPDGRIYVLETSFASCSVRLIAPDGSLTTPHPEGRCDGRPSHRSWRDIAIGPQNEIFLTTQEGGQAGNGLFRLNLDPGLIDDERIVGTGFFTHSPGACGGAGAFPSRSPVGMFPEVEVGPDGQLYLAEDCGQVRRVRANGEGAYGVTTIASDDRSEVFEFDADGRHSTTRHPLTGQVLRTFDYDASGQLVAITDSHGNITQIERDGAGVATAVVAPFGQRTELDYDANGFLETIETGDGIATHEFDYDAEGLIETYTDPRGYLHEYEHDDIGRLTLTEDSEGGHHTFEVMQEGPVYTVEKTSGLGRTTSYRFERLETGETRYTVTLPNGRQNVRTVRGRAAGEATTVLSDGTTVTSAMRSDPVFGADAPSFLEVVTTPAGLTRTTETTRTATLASPLNPYSMTQLVETTTTNGRTFTSTYNAGTDTWTTSSPLGRTSGLTLNGHGQPLASHTAGTLPVLLNYDPQGRIEYASHAGRVTELDYDTDGYLELQTNPLEEETSFDTDALGRVVQTIAPDGGETVFGYDAESNLTSLTPPGRSAHAFTYTTVDQPRSYTAPGSPTTWYVHNIDRAPTSTVLPSGFEIVHTYDPAIGRLVDVIGADIGTTTHGYDTVGRLQSLTTTGGFGSITFGYDGSLNTTVTTSGPQSIVGGWSGTLAGTAQTTYNQDHTLATMQPLGVSGAPNGFGARYNRDEDGLVSHITPVSGTGVATFVMVRDPLDGHVTGTAQGSVLTDIVLDVNASTPGTGELLSMSTAFNSTALYDFVVHDRDALGRITELEETIEGTTRTRKYEYDAAGRLERVRDQSDAVLSEYEYDQNGARTRALVAGQELELGDNLGCGPSLSTPVDSQDRLCRYGDFNYAYNADGRLATRTHIGTGTAVTYTYDSLGRLRRVASPGAPTIDYVHDALGRRVGKVVGGALQRGWLYGADSLKPLAQLSPTGAIEATYVYGTRVNVPDFIVYGPNGEGGVYRLITDHLGSVRLVVNVATGAVAQRVDYDEFGNVLVDTNPGWQPFGFAGGLYDADTGLVRFGARDYDAVTGRWTAKDPILFRGGTTNLYSYVHNDPINYVDPTGLATRETLAGTLVAAMTASIGGLVIGAAVYASTPIMVAAALTVGTGFLVASYGLNNMINHRPFTEDIVTDMAKDLAKKAACVGQGDACEWFFDLLDATLPVRASAPPNPGHDLNNQMCVQPSVWYTLQEK